MSLIGLDVGTTGCKAVAFTEEGDELARAYREYPLQHPKPGWSELSADTIWQNTQDVLQSVGAVLGNDPPAALSVSCQGEGVTPIDRNGKTLNDIVVTFDERTIPQFEWWQSRLGRKRIFQVTGMPLHPMHTINKIMWFRENRPDIFEAAHKFLCVEDFVLFRLSGELATDYSLAARTMAFDVRAREWSDEILSAAQVDRSLLPDVRPSGEVVGRIRSDVARALSLPVDMQIATGGHDQPCGALGAGIVAEGLAMNATGTSDVICPALTKPVLTKKMLDNNYSCYPHVYPDLYCSIGFNLTGGLLMRWYRDVLCAGEVLEAGKRGCDPYEIIVETASRHKARPLFLPHFVGSGTPTLDPMSRGGLFNLTIDVDKSELNRAVLDSTNYAMRLNIEMMEESGIKIERLRAVGGGAKSSKWLQLKADVFGKPVESLAISEAAALGAALLAGKAIGTYSNFFEAVNSIVRVQRTFTPRKNETDEYEEHYQDYKRLYPAVRDLNHRFSRRMYHE